MIVIAHRGASGYAPEHTFASWDLAVRFGADYLEQDLQMTKDGTLVVMHDETLDRTARRNGVAYTGRVMDRTIDELRECDVGSWFGAAFAGERVPTLEEVLKRYPDANFYIETKKPEEAPGMEEALLALLARFKLIEPARSSWRVLIQSFSEASLRKIHAIDAGLPLIQLVHRGDARHRDIEAGVDAGINAGVDAGLDAGRESWLASIAEYAVGIGPHFSDVDPALVNAAHAHCLHVHPYTVDDPAEMNRLAGTGVDGIFTNVADRALAERPTSELRGLAALRAAALANSACRASGSAAQRT